MIKRNNYKKNNNKNKNYKYKKYNNRYYKKKPNQHRRLKARLMRKIAAILALKKQKKKPMFHNRIKLYRKLSRTWKPRPQFKYLGYESKVRYKVFYPKLGLAWPNLKKRPIGRVTSKLKVKNKLSIYKPLYKIYRFFRNIHIVLKNRRLNKALALRVRKKRRKISKKKKQAIIKRLQLYVRIQQRRKQRKYKIRVRRAKKRILKRKKIKARLKKRRIIQNLLKTRFFNSKNKSYRGKGLHEWNKQNSFRKISKKVNKKKRFLKKYNKVRRKHLIRKKLLTKLYYKPYKLKFIKQNKKKRFYFFRTPYYKINRNRNKKKIHLKQKRKFYVMKRKKVNKNFIRKAVKAILRIRPKFVKLLIKSLLRKKNKKQKNIRKKVIKSRKIFFKTHLYYKKKKRSPSKVYLIKRILQYVQMMAFSNEYEYMNKHKIAIIKRLLGMRSYIAPTGYYLLLNLFTKNKEKSKKNIKRKKIKNRKKRVRSKQVKKSIKIWKQKNRDFIRSNVIELKKYYYSTTKVWNIVSNSIFKSLTKYRIVNTNVLKFCKFQLKTLRRQPINVLIKKQKRRKYRINFTFAKQRKNITESSFVLKKMNILKKKLIKSEEISSSSINSFDTNNKISQNEVINNILNINAQNIDVTLQSISNSFVYDSREVINYKKYLNIYCKKNKINFSGKVVIPQLIEKKKLQRKLKKVLKKVQKKIPKKLKTYADRDTYFKELWKSLETLRISKKSKKKYTKRKVIKLQNVKKSINKVRSVNTALIKNKKKIQNLKKKTLRKKVTQQILSNKKFNLLVEIHKLANKLINRKKSVKLFHKKFKKYTKMQLPRFKIPGKVKRRNRGVQYLDKEKTKILHNLHLKWKQTILKHSKVPFIVVRTKSKRLRRQFKVKKIKKKKKALCWLKRKSKKFYDHKKKEYVTRKKTKKQLNYYKNYKKKVKERRQGSHNSAKRRRLLKANYFIRPRIITQEGLQDYAKYSVLRGIGFNRFKIGKPRHYFIKKRKNYNTYNNKFNNFINYNKGKNYNKFNKGKNYNKYNKYNKFTNYNKFNKYNNDKNSNKDKKKISSNKRFIEFDKIKLKKKVYTKIKQQRLLKELLIKYFNNDNKQKVLYTLKKINLHKYINLPQYKKRYLSTNYVNFIKEYLKTFYHFVINKQIRKNFLNKVIFKEYNNQVNKNKIKSALILLLAKVRISKKSKKTRIKQPSQLSMLKKLRKLQKLRLLKIRRKLKRLRKLKKHRKFKLLSKKLKKLKKLNKVKRVQRIRKKVKKVSKKKQGNRKSVGTRLPIVPKTNRYFFVKKLKVQKKKKVQRRVFKKSKKIRKIGTPWLLNKEERITLERVRKEYNKRGCYRYKRRKLKGKLTRFVSRRILKTHKQSRLKGSKIQKNIIKSSYYYYFKKLRYDRIILDKLNYKQRKVKMSTKNKIKLSKFLIYLLMRVYVKKRVLKRTNMRLCLKRIKKETKKSKVIQKLKITGEKLVIKNIRKKSKKYIGALKKTVLIKVLIKILRSLLKKTKGMQKAKKRRRKIKEIIKIFLYPLLINKRQIKKVRLRKKNKIYLVMAQIFLYNMKQIIQSTNYSINFFGLIGSSITAAYVMRRLMERLEACKKGTGFWYISNTMRRLMNSKHVVGFKMKFSGRLTGNSMAQKSIIKRGIIGNSNMNVYIDYAEDNITRKHGKCGLKLWIIRNLLTYMPYKYVYTYTFKR